MTTLTPEPNGCLIIRLGLVPRVCKHYLCVVNLLPGVYTFLLTGTARALKNTYPAGGMAAVPLDGTGKVCL